MAELCVAAPVVPPWLICGAGPPRPIAMMKEMSCKAAVDSGDAISAPPHDRPSAVVVVGVALQVAKVF